MDVGERGSVKRGDDTRKKSAVTCVSRVPPSSSRAPHSQPFFFFFVLSYLGFLVHFVTGVLQPASLGCPLLFLT